jgi:hypothetical protein
MRVFVRGGEGKGGREGKGRRGEGRLHVLEIKGYKYELSGKGRNKNSRSPQVPDRTVFMFKPQTLSSSPSCTFEPY